MVNKDVYIITSEFEKSGSGEGWLQLNPSWPDLVSVERGQLEPTSFETNEVRSSCRPSPL